MNIAKLNAQLTSTAAGFAAGLKQGEKALGSFRSVFSSTAGKLTGIAGALGIGLSAASLVAFTNGNLQAIDALDDAATSIGVTTDALSRLQYATSFAGVEAETLRGSLSKMLNNLDAATTGSGAAATAITKLGLDATTLANMAPEQAFAAIADKIASIQNPAAKTAAAMDIFGKSGAALIPVLNGGSEGLQAMYEEADRLGVTVKATDATKVAAAADAMQRVGAVIQGIGQSIAIELAPYIEALSNQFVEAAGAGEGIGPKVTAAIEWVATGIAYASGVIDLFKGAWYGVQGTIQAVVSGILYALDSIAQQVVKVINLIPGMDVSFEGIKDAAELFADAATESFDAAGQSFSDLASGKRVKAVEDFFSDVKAGANAAADAAHPAANAIGQIGDEAAAAQAKVAETIEKLQKQISQFNMTAAEKLAADLAAEGATPEQIAQAKAAQEQLDALEQQKKAQEDAQKAAQEYYDSTRTAQEKYAAEIERINKLQADGQLDAETAQRARDAAAEQLQGDQQKEKTQQEGPQLLQAGTQEAASFVANLQRGQGDEQKTIAKNTATANKTLARIADNTATNGGATAITVVQF